MVERPRRLNGQLISPFLMLCTSPCLCWLFANIAVNKSKLFGNILISNIYNCLCSLFFLEKSVRLLLCKRHIICGVAVVYYVSRWVCIYCPSWISIPTAAMCMIILVVILMSVPLPLLNKIYCVLIWCVPLPDGQQMCSIHTKVAVRHKIDFKSRNEWFIIMTHGLWVCVYYWAGI